MEPALSAGTAKHVNTNSHVGSIGMKSREPMMLDEHGPLLPLHRGYDARFMVDAKNKK